MRRPSAERVAKWAAVSSAVLLGGTVLLCTGILRDSGVPGTDDAGALIILLALAVAIGALATRRALRRPPRRGFDPVLPADAPAERSSPPGVSVPRSDRRTRESGPAA